MTDDTKLWLSDNERQYLTDLLREQETVFRKELMTTDETGADLDLLRQTKTDIDQLVYKMTEIRPSDQVDPKEVFDECWLCGQPITNGELHVDIVLRRMGNRKQVGVLNRSHVKCSFDLPGVNIDNLEAIIAGDPNSPYKRD